MKYKFDEEDLWEILKECEEEFDTLNILRYQVDNIRFRNYSASQAACNFTLRQDKTINVEIAVRHKIVREEANFSRQDLKNLIMHELIHTVIYDDELPLTPPWEVEIIRPLGHGEEWNRIARLVQEKFPEYDFFDDISDEDIFFPDSPVQFIIRCPNCGAVERYRKTYPRPGTECPFCGEIMKAEYAR